MNNIKELENKIRYYNNLWWKENKIIISDIEYDKLIEKLKTLDPTNELLNEIQDPITTSKKKIYHKKPMLSLEKVYNDIDLLKWCKKVSRSPDEIFKIELKYDGVSGSLENGVLSTRGNGEIGEDISDKLPLIKILRNKNPSDPNVIRGEILFSKSDFQKNRKLILKKDGEEYKNERNAVGGILNREDIDHNIGRILTLVEFDYNFYTLKLSDLETIITNNKFEEIKERVQQNNFPADGMVFKIYDNEYAKKLGYTSHHPKSEIAFKFTNPFGYSKLIEVNWSIGKNTITPIGRIEPVEIGKIIVQNVNLHNMKNIIDRDIHIGDSLKVERAGDVIPFVTGIKVGEKRTDINITICPSCGYNIKYEEPEIICTNPNCPGKHLAKLIDSVVRIGIERLGLPTLQKMIYTLKIHDLVDIFNLKEEDILQLDGFAESSSKNLFNEIQKVKQNGVFEWQILSSLNLNGIGKTLSKSLLENISLKELRKYSLEQLKETIGIGLERAQILFNGLKTNEDLINKLLEILQIRNNKIERKMERPKICFTGKFPEKKSYYYNLIKDHYEIVERITKDLDLLIVADPNKKTNKLLTGEKLGIKIISIEELLKTV